MRYYEVAETGEDQSKWITLTDPVRLDWLMNCNQCASNVTDIGFDFPFGGTIVRHFAMNTEGQVTMGNYSPSVWDHYRPLSYNGQSNSRSYENPWKISVWGRDSWIRADVFGDYWKTQLIGTAPNRVRVIEFQMRGYYGGYYGYSNNTHLYQVQLYESTGEILLIYGPKPERINENDLCYQVGLRGKVNNEWEVFYIKDDHQGYYSKTDVIEERCENDRWPGDWRYYRLRPACVGAGEYDYIFSSVHHNEATVSWRPAVNVDSWDIEYGTGERGDMANHRILNITDTHYTMTGLQASTRYNVYVTGHCVLDGSPVLVTDDSAFTTACAIERNDMPYSENFDSYGDESGYVSTNAGAPAQYTGNHHYLPDCWKFPMINTTNTGTYPQAFLTTQSDIVRTGKALLFRDNNFNYPSVAVLPPTEVGINKTSISFWYRYYNTNGYQFYLGYVTDPDDPSTFVRVDGPYPWTTTYTQVQYDFSRHSEAIPENAQIAIYRRNNNGDNWFVIDDIVIDSTMECPAVSNVSVMNTSASSVTLRWDATEGAQYYAVCYGERDFTLGASGSHYDTAYGTSITIAGLDAGTAYDFYVKAQCSRTSSGQYSKVLVTTRCRMSFPYMERFNDVIADGRYTDVPTTQPAQYTAGTHYLPQCWSFPYLKRTTNEWPQAYVISTASNTLGFTYTHGYTGHALLLRATSNTGNDYLPQRAYAVLPQFDAPLDSLYIGFWYRTWPMSNIDNDETGNFELGYLTDPDDPLSFVMVKTLGSSNVYKFVDHDFATDRTRYPSGAVICFRYCSRHTDRPAYLDDIFVDRSGRVGQPNAVVSVLTNTTATVSWQYVTSAS
ncbi:MAG: fibronectin type III domain-containing protein, partial [Bacteroidales bacterium]|nr:fibronectin type III domain-containing protein [Bacteroidales bacterium]